MTKYRNIKEWLLAPEARTESLTPPRRKPLGLWLVENMPRGTNLEIPRERESNRPIPFVDWDEGDSGEQ